MKLVTGRWAQNLNRDHASVRERDRLGGIRNTRRNVRIIKRIEERIAYDREAAAVVSVKYDSATPVAAVTKRSVRIGIGRVSINVLIVNPRFHVTTTHCAGRFLVG